MSEEDAEIALLHQLQAGADATAWEQDEGMNGATEGEGELSSNTEHNIQQVKKEPVADADDQVLRALSPSAASVTVSDGGEYDPLSVTALPTITTLSGPEDSRSSSRSSMRKKKTVGGFIADDSDEENDDATPTPISASLLQPPTSNPPKRAISPSPLQTSITQQDLNSTSENRGDSKVKPSSSSTVSVNLSNVGTPQLAQVPTPTTSTSAQGTALTKARLPHDVIGRLEDRIKEDPRGALEDGWLPLISEHRKRNKLDDARAVYDRFFKVFPQAAEIWVAYTEMELEHDSFPAAEALFARSLMTVPNVQLWSVYLNYIRRMNDLTNDAMGTARTTISQAYEFVLATIGIDRDSGRIWQEYIQFIRSAPGQIGGSSWQDQQKMDQLRKAYQRAICVPMSSVNGLWKEYDQFEMSLNKLTGRKFLQEKSPSYMSARSANTALENLTRGLSRTTLPKLPPMLGFEGHEEYQQQVELWKKWISWEQEDPLVLKADELPVYKQRVLYVYKQAVMAMRFWPEIWVDAAEWCFNNDLDSEGDAFLSDGIAANPESCLIAFKKADRLETTLPTEAADKNDIEKGAIVREPYQKLLDSLYDLVSDLKVRQAREQTKLEEDAALDATISTIVSKAEDDEDNDADKAQIEADKANQLKAIQQGYDMQRDLLKRTISFAWIALMRAMRRIQGNGAKSQAGGSRAIFADARPKGMLTSEVYVASALIEHHVYNDKSGTKIFEKGAKLFPLDETFILEYLKHLISIPDITNARVVFETSVSRLTQNPDTIHKAKPLYIFFHKYESHYGTFEQIKKLERRMAELYPDDPRLLRFAARYTGTDGFDPTAVRPIISPSTQTKPKILMQSIEQQPSLQNSPRPNYIQAVENSPRPQYIQTTNSPKRPFPIEDMENDANRPRKLARGESPLKGAAGRRLDQQKRLQTQGTPTWQSNGPPPFVVPRDITFLLSIIPKPELYYTDPQLQNLKFNSDALVRMLAQTNVPDYGSWKAAREAPRYDGMQSNPAPNPGYPRVDAARSDYERTPSSWNNRSQGGYDRVPSETRDSTSSRAYSSAEAPRSSAGYSDYTRAPNDPMPMNWQSQSQSQGPYLQGSRGYY